MHLLLLASYAPSLLNFRGPLIADIVAAGHRVSVGAPGIGPDLRARIEALGAEVHDTPLDRTGTGIIADLRYGAALRRLMARIRPDIVLSYTIKPNIWGAFAAARQGIPSVAMVTGLGYAFTDSGAAPVRQRLLRGIARRLYRAATNRNARVIFQNPDDREDFLAMGCLADPSRAGMVNGSGVDMAHYARVPLPDAPVFLMIARLLRNKGVREYAEAALRLMHEHPEARCLLVGPFDEGPDAVSRADLDRWVAAGLEYLGPLDDVRPALAQARIYVLPSYREGTPRSVLEAMAMGRAIITTDAPGCRETIRDGIEGHLVPVRDAETLKNTMAGMLKDPNGTALMADAAHARAHSKYDVRVVNRRMLALLGLSEVVAPSAQNSTDPTS
jgi:glycosyltransferase involved in cell wall biosynthesis